MNYVRAIENVMSSVCQVCLRQKDCVGAIVAGNYYSSICRPCIASFEPHNKLSAGHLGWEQRRDYEDVADDAVQPYNANGPNPEFFRLYPEQSKKILSPSEIEWCKTQI